MVDWKGREKSNSVVDMRSYMGSRSRDPSYSQDERFADFIREIGTNPYADYPQELTDQIGVSIEDIINQPYVEEISNTGWGGPSAGMVTPTSIDSLLKFFGGLKK